MTPLPQLSDTEFRRIQRVVYETAGIAISDSSRTLLSSRVRKRLRALQLDSFRDYLQHLGSDRNGRELDALMDVVSTNETSFFRTPAHFGWFADEFLTERREATSRTDNDLSIWSAACSTGEEPYSLAIVLLQQQARLSRFNVRLFATDISASAVEKAREGLYPPSGIEKLDQDVRRFFTPSESGKMSLSQTVRKQVQFATHNLMQPAPYQDLDCIFLRNVLIYFDQESKDRVLSNAIDALRLGGYLVVGPSEGVIDIPSGLQRVQSFLFRRC